jgi:5-methylcytosine-specific restriction endonuclease McrA
MDNTEYRQYLQSDKWKAIASKRLQIDNFQCNCCGSRGTPQNPLEVHHLSYNHVYHEESRIYEDLVTLCHICHKGIHNVMNRQTNAQGRRGWTDNRTIPQIHTFNVTGTQTEHIEIGARY